MAENPGGMGVARRAVEVERIYPTDESQSLVKLTDAQIDSIRQTILQAEKLVFTVLEGGVDYGPHPGTDSLALKDCGASKIANAFNCYPEHVILHLTENEDLVSYLIQAKLTNRATGRIVAIGVGACSTMESKYAYRWVMNPEEYGHDKTSLKYDKNKKKWRIPNPDIEDLGNTILKMASKRAEVDASQGLPGVSSALVKLLQGKKRTEKALYDGPNWQKFWGEVAALGLTEDDVHSLLGIKSLKDDWLAKGKSLNQAVEIVAQKVATSQTTVIDGHEVMEVPWEGLRSVTSKDESTPKFKRDPGQIKDIAGLLRACNEDFKLQPADVYKELGFSSAQQITKKPEDCYREIAAVRRTDQ